VVDSFRLWQWGGDAYTFSQGTVVTPCRAENIHPPTIVADQLFRLMLLVVAVDVECWRKTDRWPWNNSDLLFDTIST